MDGIALLKAFSNLILVVQDLAANAESGRKAAAESMPADITNRLTFQAP